jgi:drug/metabolite transporter (DMT)-like permease
MKAVAPDSWETRAMDKPHYFSFLRVLSAVVSVSGVLVLLGPGLESKMPSSTFWALAGFALVLLGSLLGWVQSRRERDKSRTHENAH